MNPNPHRWRDTKEPSLHYHLMAREQRALSSLGSITRHYNTWLHPCTSLRVYCSCCVAFFSFFMLILLLWSCDLRTLALPCDGKGGEKQEDVKKEDIFWLSFCLGGAGFLLSSRLSPQYWDSYLYSFCLSFVDFLLIHKIMWGLESKSESEAATKISMMIKVK